MPTPESWHAHAAAAMSERRDLRHLPLPEAIDEAFRIIREGAGLPVAKPLREKGPYVTLLELLEGIERTTRRRSVPGASAADFNDGVRAMARATRLALEELL